MQIKNISIFISIAIFLLNPVIVHAQETPMECVKQLVRSMKEDNKIAIRKLIHSSSVEILEKMADARFDIDVRLETMININVDSDYKVMLKHVSQIKNFDTERMRLKKRDGFIVFPILPEYYFSLLRDSKDDSVEMLYGDFIARDRDGEFKLLWHVEHIPHPSIDRVTKQKGVDQ